MALLSSLSPYHQNLACCPCLTIACSVRQSRLILIIARLAVHPEGRRPPSVRARFGWLMAQMLAAICASQQRSVASLAFAQAPAGVPPCAIQARLQLAFRSGSDGKKRRRRRALPGCHGHPSPTRPANTAENPWLIPTGRPGSPVNKAHRIRHGPKSWRCRF